MASLLMGSGLARGQEGAGSDPSVAPHGGVELICLNRFQNALSFRDEWDALIERLGGDVFGTLDWCATWWKHFGQGRSLLLLLARSKGELVAVWPLFKETIRWGPAALRVVRVVGCDHGVTTCRIYCASEHYGEVARKVLAEIERAGAWDLLHIGEMPGYADGLPGLVEALKTSPLARDVLLNNDAYPHAVFDVPSDFEHYLLGLSLKERRNVRRDERQIMDQGGITDIPSTAEEIDAALGNLIELHRSHWRIRGRAGHFDEVDEISGFYREIAQKFSSQNRLAWAQTQVGGQVVASELAFQFNRRLHWIIGGRRENVTARIGFCALMRLAVREKLSLIDGLAGEYDYKRRLGASQLSIKTISVLPHGGLRALRLGAVSMIVSAVSLIYHKIWFWRVAPWLMRRAPHLARLVVRPGLWKRFARSRFLVAARKPSPAVTALTDESD